MGNLFKIVLIVITVGEISAINPVKDYKFHLPAYIENIDSSFIRTDDGAAVFLYTVYSDDMNIGTSIIMAYGDSGNLSYCLPYAVRLNQMGYSVILFDYRGFGNSSAWENNENMLFYSEYAVDLNHVIDYTKRKYPENKIGIMAFSMGTIISTLSTQNDSVDFFIFENYVTCLKETLKRINKRSAGKMVLPHNFDLEKYSNLVRNINIPLLVFNAKDDRVIKEKDLHILSKKKCVTVNYNGNHGCGYATLGENYFDTIREFLFYHTFGE
ncbi:MAG: alpha/beta hydrolase [Tannerellaceae bacterium]|jgi:predicted alpha/beta hydrolase|nr:alpha/beta hydrolase [Tannerellaceae bacterium]